MHSEGLRCQKTFDANLKKGFWHQRLKRLFKQYQNFNLRPLGHQDSGLPMSYHAPFFLFLLFLSFDMFFIFILSTSVLCSIVCGFLSLMIYSLVLGKIYSACSIFLLVCLFVSQTFPFIFCLASFIIFLSAMNGSSRTWGPSSLLDRILGHLK